MEYVLTETEIWGNIPQIYNITSFNIQSLRPV